MSEEHPVPSYRGEDAFAAQQRAYAGDGELPAFWTPQHVGARMIEAVDVLFRTVGHVGPRAFANAWPEFSREWEDLLDEDAWRNHQEDAIDTRPRPDRFAISRSDEALEWPNKFLREFPLQLDAIRLWSWSKARGIPAEPILLDRKRRAERLLPATLAAMNAARAAAAREFATDLTLDANRRCAILAKKGKLTPLRREKINNERHEAFEAERHRFIPLRIEQIELRHALPGKCLAPATYHRMRKDACARIADMLIFMEVPIR